MVVVGVVVVGSQYDSSQRATTMPSDTDSALSNEADAVGSHLLLGNTRQQTVAEYGGGGGGGGRAVPSLLRK